MKSESEILEEPQQIVSYTPKTPLGKRLLEIRAALIASGERLLDREGIEKEIADRRGEV